MRRRPLVVVGGAVGELPIGDTLSNTNVPVYDAAGTLHLLLLTSDGKVPFIIADGTTHSDVPLVEGDSSPGLGDLAYQMANAVSITGGTVGGKDVTALVDTSTAQTLSNKSIRQSINAQTGTTFTPALSDAGKLVTLNNAAAIALTIPPNSSVAFGVGDSVDFAQIGAGQVTVSPGSGVTLIATPGLKFRAQGSAATAVKIATDTWLLVGDLSA
ncbi:hypothetical protein OTERR_13220 [Oryzomicrobium terrae]|uniref:Uncharacterized protein n=1 Tax=Oryzomicrobium terrae TaxID=1735038 RepID=A0A5C1E962_9RHOO|nr:hypothetical protein [Oryzomicrobium terrae]QEL64798.1 hypothetical protein OTERR_13220 [Oryzomicrobium terrae]